MIIIVSNSLYAVNVVPNSLTEWTGVHILLSATPTRCLIKYWRSSELIVNIHSVGHLKCKSEFVIYKWSYVSIEPIDVGKTMVFPGIVLHRNGMQLSSAVFAHYFIYSQRFVECW